MTGVVRKPEPRATARDRTAEQHIGRPEGPTGRLPVNVPPVVTRCSLEGYALVARVSPRRCHTNRTLRAAGALAISLTWMASALAGEASASSGTAAVFMSADGTSGLTPFREALHSAEREAHHENRYRSRGSAS